MTGIETVTIGGESIQVRERPFDPAIFERAAPRGRKLRCKVCSATGYPETEYRYSVSDPWNPDNAWWGASHDNHPWPCSSCERAFTTPQGLSQHRRRKHA